MNADFLKEALEALNTAWDWADGNDDIDADEAERILRHLEDAVESVEEALRLAGRH